MWWISQQIGSECNMWTTENVKNCNLNDTINASHTNAIILCFIQQNSEHSILLWYHHRTVCYGQMIKVYLVHISASQNVYGHTNLSVSSYGQ